MELKLVLVWALGSLLLMAGTWIMGNLELTIGVTSVSYAIALLAAFILLMLAGLCWISVAVATKGH
ncbi:MAG: hypothetical protein JXC85_00215 [Candidatus Aenigmarchaeota archaeon]|nr:hypothetical protein [Candidatus Aenigmarchaeota archaeon]